MIVAISSFVELGFAEWTLLLVLPTIKPQMLNKINNLILMKPMLSLILALLLAHHALPLQLRLCLLLLLQLISKLNQIICPNRTTVLNILLFQLLQHYF